MDEVAQVREKTDIVALLSEYLPLKKMGRNFKTACPFHGEKTPSFVVSPERQIWHCFGCQKGGDAYTFLMEYENLEFSEALQTLAKRAGITLQRKSFSSTNVERKDTLYSVNHLALEFYHYILTKLPAGEKAQKYLLEKRRITPAIIKTFQIGFSPTAGNALVKYLVGKKKYKKDILLEAGLAYERNGMLYDFFVGRIMFPLFDHRDNIIGFSGRVLTDEKTTMGKYINTKETAIYHKRSALFGLHIAKQAIKKENQVILMEGEFDVISSFQEGITNAIAVKGTALTEEQVSLIARFTSKVTLCFDNDKAGLEALKRSVPLLEKKGLTVTVIDLLGKDPDSAILSDVGAFQKAVKHDISVYDFLLAQLLSVSDVKTAAGKKQVSDEMLSLLQHIENEIIKEHYLRKLATSLDTTYESIERQLDKYGKKKEEVPVEKVVKKQRTRDEILEEYLLALMVQSPDMKKAVLGAKENLAEVLKNTRASQKLLQELFTYFDQNEVLDVNVFATTLPEELLTTYNTCFLYPLPKFVDETHYYTEVKKISAELRILTVRERLREISDIMKLKELRGESDDEELTSLNEEFVKLSSQLQ